MKILTPERVIGSTIEGIFQLSLPGRANYEGKLVLVQLCTLGFLPLELADPDSPPALRLHVGDVGEPVTDPAVASLIGRRVADIIVSRYLASVSLICDNGSILTNDVLEFGNFAAVVTGTTKFIAPGQYRSLKSMPGAKS